MLKAFSKRSRQRKKYPIKIFEDKFDQDILIGEVKDRHVILKGADEFVSRALKWRRLNGA